MRVEVPNYADKVTGHTEGSEDGTQLGVVDRGVSAFEVYVCGEAVPARGNSVFEGELQKGDGSGAGVPLTEALLCFRENLVRLSIVSRHLRKDACPQLVQAVSEVDGAIILQVSGVPHFVEQNSGAVEP